MHHTFLYMYASRETSEIQSPSINGQKQNITSNLPQDLITSRYRNYSSLAHLLFFRSSCQVHVSLFITTAKEIVLAVFGAVEKLEIDNCHEKPLRRICGGIKVFQQVWISTGIHTRIICRGLQPTSTLFTFKTNFDQLSIYCCIGSVIF